LVFNTFLVNTSLLIALFSAVQQATLHNRFITMNKLSISQIRQKSGLYYAVGIAIFSSLFVVVVVIAKIVASNS
jgi:hypothetical protein